MIDHFACQWVLQGEYEDSDGVITRQYKCSRCGKTMQTRVSISKEESR